MKKTSQKKRRTVDRVSIVLALVILIVSIVGVNCYVQQYEKGQRLAALNGTLAEEQNRGQLLDIEYNSRANYRSIEQYVTEHMSMKKISDYQIEYVDDGSADTMRVIEHEEDGSLLGRISKAFSVILEYFR